MGGAGGRGHACCPSSSGRAVDDFFQTSLAQVAEIEDALAQPLGGNISAAERAELEKRADAMRQAAARLQRVSAVRGDAPSGSGPTLDTIESGKHA